jgi:hypothetical protein
MDLVCLNFRLYAYSSIISLLIVFVKEGNSLYCSYAFLCARLGVQVTVNSLLKPQSTQSSKRCFSAYIPS